MFEWLSRVGTFGGVWIVIALVFALAWRRWGVLIVTAAAVALADLAATALKALIDVQRPSTRYLHPKPLVGAPHDHSFPSGHAATSFAAATVLCAFVPRGAPLSHLLREQGHQIRPMSSEYARSYARPGGVTSEAEVIAETAMRPTDQLQCPLKTTSASNHHIPVSCKAP